MWPIFVSATVDPIDVRPRTIVHALKSIVNQVYVNRTSTISIVVQSSRVGQSELDPREVAGELVEFEYNQAPITYYIENTVKIKRGNSPQHFNLILVDGYESFR